MNKVRLIIYIFIVLVLLSVAVGIYKHNENTRNDVQKLIHEKKLINILLTGSNKKVDNTYNHSFYMIISINPVNNSVGFIFLPPSFRINTDDDENPYIRLDQIEFLRFSSIQKTILKNIKINIPYYVQLYSDDVERIVNLVGGADLFILDQVKDMTDFTFGQNYLDGKKVIKYINSVEDSSIYLKYDRIQDLLLTFYQDKKFITNYSTPEYLKLIFKGRKTISTNLKLPELNEIAKILKEPSNVITTTMPGNFTEDMYVVDDISYKIYEKNFLKEHIVGPEKAPNDKIKILNGTNISGLARKLKNKLKKEGFNVVEFATSPYPKMNKSIIVNRIGNNSQVIKRLIKKTGITNTYNIIDNTELNNILIIIGEDFKLDSKS